MTCALGPGVGGIVLLQDLFAGVDAEVPAGAAGVDVRALAVDSRRGGARAPFCPRSGAETARGGFPGPGPGGRVAGGAAGPPPPPQGPGAGAPQPRPPLSPPPP